MKKYDLYLFDFDGTLFNTFDALEYVFTYSYGKIGVEFKKEDTLEFSRIPLRVGYDKYGCDEKDIPAFIEAINYSLDTEESFNRHHLYEESLEFFKYVREHNIKCGIVTSNNINHVQSVLKTFDIPIDTFVIYIGNRECHHFKPHPDPIFKALEKYDYKGDLSKVVYVGDGINDTQSANAAGVDAILIDRIDAFGDSNKYYRIDNLMKLFK